MSKQLCFISKGEEIPEFVILIYQTYRFQWGENFMLCHNPKPKRLEIILQWTLRKLSGVHITNHTKARHIASHNKHFLLTYISWQVWNCLTILQRYFKPSVTGTNPQAQKDEDEIDIQHVEWHQICSSGCKHDERATKLLRYPARQIEILVLNGKKRSFSSLECYSIWDVEEASNEKMIDWFNFIKQKAAQKFLKKSSARGSNSKCIATGLIHRQTSQLDELFMSCSSDVVSWRFPLKLWIDWNE